MKSTKHKIFLILKILLILVAVIAVAFYFFRDALLKQAIAIAIAIYYH